MSSVGTTSKRSSISLSKDFYLNERALAGYVEKDWFDHVLPSPRMFEYAAFDPRSLYCDYHEQLIRFLSGALAKEQLSPIRILEVGSSLGRTFYEICRQISSVQSATLIEPSQLLHSTFNRIFSGDGVIPVSVLKGNFATDEVSLDTRSIRSTCAHVEVSSLNQSFQEVDRDRGVASGDFDLVICSNVIDQCSDHLELVEFLKRSVAPGGTLLLSCTYQWSEKYIGNAPVMIKDVNELFSADWKFIGETNLPFQFRVNERYWMNFLSHAVLYQCR